MMFFLVWIMAEPIFKIENVTKVFGNHVVLNDITLDIHSGEIIGIIGASGTGKTTFLNTIIGFVRPNSGDVKFRLNHLLTFKDTAIYRSVYKKTNSVKKVYGFAAQTPSLYDELTAKENLYFFGALYDLSNDAIETNAETLLSLMNLRHAKNVKAENLSGGMKRRLDIACALMHDPDVLILDEPTADLDPMHRSHIWSLIRKINVKGTTIILSSHHLNELENLCDRVAIIKDTKLIAVDKPENLMKKFTVEQEIIFRSTPGDYRMLLKSIPKKALSHVRTDGENVHIHSSNVEKVLIDVLAALKKHDEKLVFIKVVGASLDDVFISIWENDEDD